MLNELYHLSMTIEKAGIVPQDWHGALKSLPNSSPKNPCYKILINADSSIAGIEPMQKDLVSSLRKCQFGSNGFSFPGFNIKSLFCIKDVKEKKIFEKWSKSKKPFNKEHLKKWCVKENETDWNELMLNKCLGSIPQELKQRCGQIPDNFVALNFLFERIGLWGDNGCSEFIKALKSYMWVKIEADENIDNILPLLLKLKPENISVYLDVPDWKEFPVANENTIQYINECLLKQTDAVKTKVDECNMKDAFGSNINGSEYKLPEVKLPILGSIKLRAMNSESPCQYRYNTIDAKSFIIGKDSRKSAKGALEWLASDEFEGKTWGRVDGKEIIFAYPTIIPKSPAKLASFLGARKTDNTKARFAKYAEDVVCCLKGLAPSLKDVELRIFSLRKMDKARTKVIFHRNDSAQRLVIAAKEWQQGCSNIPDISMKTWGKDKGVTILAAPETPFPLQVAECLNRIWTLDGMSKKEVKSIPISTGIGLLLDESLSLRHIPHLIKIAIKNSRGLFLSLGNSLHFNEIIKFDGFNKHKQLMPSIIGLLLWKIGIRKEIYMNNPPYAVGRMLKMADELHALYCKEVRNNSMPPQLLGNALIITALDSPTQAIAQLALRISPYLGWARTNSTGSAGLSRYFLKEFGLIESKVRNATFPARFDDASKAQLFLGYIADNSKTDESITNNNEGIKK
ncbi:MAG: hypothetical protein K9L30_02290 [Desulfobacterales bacterium]|nr:hypothetical protein [Desulfobacterales bacterium]